MQETPKRDHPITTRFRATQKDLAVLAARQEGVTLSEFVRQAVVTSAAQTLTPRTVPGA